jgi:ABC-type lipoprotein export system ATPase subunit
MSELRINALQYRYPSGTNLAFAEFSCRQGDDMLLLGQSGSGKTTLLHLLAGILSAAHGEILYGNENLAAMKPSEKDAFRGKNIGMIFQKNYFIEGITVLENLRAACRLSGNHADTAWLEDLMKQLGIARLSGKKPSELSEGEQQRFSIARALANKPLWVLADEPTSSLDDANCENFVNLMKKDYSGIPVSWIIATHDNRLKQYFNHIYQL